MAARLKASLDAQSRQQQQKQELIAGMSHDLKSPLTSIRAYTEGLLDGVAKDEATRTRYLQTIYAKETELESLVNRLFAFAKLDLREAPAHPEPLDLSETLRDIVDGYDAENLDLHLREMPEGRALAQHHQPAGQQPQIRRGPDGDLRGRFGQDRLHFHRRQRPDVTLTLPRAQEG